MRAVLLGCLVLAGCTDRISAAEQRHAMAMRSAVSDDERCQIERTLADEYLAANEAEKFKKQKFDADAFCLELQIQRNLRPNRY